MKKWVEKYHSFKNKYVVKKRREYEYITNRYYAHVIDPFFTKWAYDLKLHPNAVTILSGIVGMTSAIMFLTDHLIIAGSLLQVHYLLDGADGNLARLKNQCTSFGAQLDRYVDQFVRLALFLCIAIGTECPLWLKVLFIVTPYIDTLVVHFFVLPYIREYPVVRARWKQWFLERGILPAFDIFLVFVLISLFSFLNEMQMLMWVVIIGKNLDWIYRVWEVVRSKRKHKKK